jgi:gliding motility-associated-like protein
MSIRYYNILFILFFPFLSFGQKETNIWYFGDRAGLDFNQNPPAVLLDGAFHAHEGSAVLSDGNGNLLFYTNGEEIWNKHHQLMENGAELGGHQSARQSSVIVPKPGDPGRYYVFTMDALENKHRNGLMYSIVDIKENGGLGKVLEKNIQLHGPGSEALAVSGSCREGEAQEFWVLASNIDHPGKIYAYKVDKSGVHKDPVISSVQVKKSINYIKFSPASNKVVLVDDKLYNDKEDRQILIAGFDFASGHIFNIHYISVKPTISFTQAEFSPNGKFLYVSSGSEIFQIDLASNNRISERLATREGKGQFQLAPDGNIYISTLGNYLSVILDPNSEGLKGKFQEYYLDLNGRESRLGLPNFVSSYLYNGLNPDAGKDTLVCSGQPIKLGAPAEEEASYEWYPAEHLSNNQVAQPVFQYHNSTNKVQEFEYILTAYNDICAKKDTIRIKVPPAPPERISGSRSVCPGVVEVAYSVPAKEGYSYLWEVEGGRIAAGQGSSDILVDWGPTNPEALVRLISSSSSGCEVPVLELPVRINVELDTETPQGLEEVCFNHRQQVFYSVTHTNGSVYSWLISGGEITGGQGTHQVEVSWEGNGTAHLLWLQEKSVTIDTVCYGISDTLNVLVFKDSTEISLDYVSISLEDDQKAEIQGNKSQATRISGDFTIFRRPWGSEDWQKVGTTTEVGNTFTDSGLQSDKLSYEYRISSLNPCGEEIISPPHRSILLSGKAQEDNNQVLLEWNPYEGWKKGVEKYEIWTRVDGEEEYRLLAATDRQTRHFVATTGLDGFLHNFRIKAVGREHGWVSWSNELHLRFEHPLRIPNVFTPNGDKFNQTFRIEKLEMYPDNDLTIYNRWGKIVYQKKGYQGEWDGSGLTSGVYYYSLKLPSAHQIFHGWVQILRSHKEISE